MEEILRGNEPNPPKESMEYIYNFNMAWPIYTEEDKRPTIMNHMFDEVKKDTQPRVSSKEELDSMEERPYSITVDEGIIVTDVVYTDDNGYEFTIKESGIRCRTNYSWAFWENTPTNLIKIEKYRKEKRELEKQQAYTYSLLDKIDKIVE